MRQIAITLVVGAIVGGFVGGFFGEATFSVLGCMIGGAGTLAAVFVAGRSLHLADEKKKAAGALTPEMRAVFDRMTGRAPAPAGTACVMCGQPRASGDGYMCRSCTDFLKANGNNSIHACGGCGAGFLVASGMDVYTFSEGGVDRVFCACCQEHLKRMATGGNTAMPPIQRGYDDEGRGIVARFPGLPLSETLKHRSNQAQLRTVIKNKARRTGASPAEPIFLAEG